MGSPRREITWCRVTFPPCRYRRITRLLACGSDASEADRASEIQPAEGP
jgi:hypothetical protein